MAFHEVRFPDNISRGARGGPERRTQIVELASGDEEQSGTTPAPVPLRGGAALARWPTLGPRQFHGPWVARSAMDN